ncbi:hypothetical protein SAMN02745883_00793 [Caminicella sporogenes DSM 14501]|uniref:Uncharacterized protein n=1 Tax=Caminicella sporogenes DSM 14501 TaxID=1121266 RepID=A0A1M6N4C3_9FIRM|nr:hypothetical protein [Caminicella sporogenes]RKD22367.1 hypothetical protein BET04_04855 [Caminicella sporogenes]WIF95181.1 hypothetical protein QNI18_00645 [Caminicella sporogenes]SHJ90559.1 hypothetical protein SAMN02745883_00793 [Caminicella sporogenes DSM 14501]
MERYTKIIGLTGSCFIREYKKKKHHKNKLREVKEDTVAKFFLEGSAEVLVVFEETGKEILLNINSNPDDIMKYLGKSFLP